MKDIIIEYLLSGEEEFKKIILSPDDFFDPLEEGQISHTVFGSIQKYFLEPRDYINVEQSNILFLNFYIQDDDGNRIINRHTYWEKGLSQIEDHSEYKKGELYYRTIICSVNSDGDKKMLLRLEELNHQLIPITHSVSIIGSEYDTIKKSDLSMFKNIRDMW